MASPILVTGAAGFIGSHVCEKLVSTRDVVGIDNFDPFYARATKEQNLKTLRTQSRFTFHEIDIRDWESLAAAYAAIKPSAVIHLAARAGVRPSILDPIGYNDVNVKGTLNLLELAKQHATKVFVFASSSSVYGNHPQVPFAETHNVDNPISPYAATKKACELLCYTYHHLTSLSVACLRFFTVYGARQRPDLAIHKFTKAILTDSPITLFGDGSTSRDYTYIDDIVAGVTGCLAWLEQQPVPTYEIFNLGNSEPTRLDQLVELLEKLTGKKAVRKRAAMQEGDVERTYADVRKAHKYFGYAPKTPIEQGLDVFVDWMRQQLRL